MEKDEINSVFQYLDIDTEGKKINKIAFPLLVVEALSCFVFGERISFLITFSFAMAVFMFMLIWGGNINGNSKSLFLYLGVGGTLWSLCFMLIALGISNIDLLYGCVVFILMVLFSVPANLYIVKMNARKVLNVKGNYTDIKIPESYYKVCGALGVLVGTVMVKILSSHARNFVIVVCGYFVAYGCQYMAIRCFYKHIIRRRYHIDELLEQRAKAKIKPGMKQ